MEEKEKILQYALKKFKSKGFQNFTMDGIAQEMHVSKKTIYKYFSSKDNLLQEAIDLMLEGVRFRKSEIAGLRVNAVAKIANLFAFVTELLLEINRDVLEELRVNRPQLWNRIETFRENNISSFFRETLDQGKKEELVMDYPTPVMIQALTSSIGGVINPDFFMVNDISLQAAQETVMEIIIRGVLTKKGKKLFKEYKAEKSGKKK